MQMASIKYTKRSFVLQRKMANFKISWASNFGSKIWAKRWAKPNFSSQFL